MNAAVETEASRPRPLSGGLWTLFSWLRRDERSSSSDSLSSAGSDRTVASFAFLAPAHYRTPTPLVLPQSPPTDSYKKRVRDRNIRRQHDRDLTLHRKYGLYRSDGGYDAFSLPPARRALSNSGDIQERERRATSESLQRRAAYVPGKRRAPLPPNRTAVLVTSSLPRRYSRKRPAPQPPVKLSEKINKSVEALNYSHILAQMNSQPIPDSKRLPHNDVIVGCKSEKCSKKDVSRKENKCRSEKSFLKQIFENKKRNSSIETNPGKILPSISELDKQAAELIESCKLKAREQNNNVEDLDITKIIKESSRKEVQENAWICTKCLRKYNASTLTCLHCLPEQKRSSVILSKDNKKSIFLAGNSTQTDNVNNVARTSNSGTDEKQKLKEMLKEMKDSLPKRPKHDNTKTSKCSTNKLVRDETHVAIETPTLRIGSNSNTVLIPNPVDQTTSEANSKTKTKNDSNIVVPNNIKPTETVVITQTIVLTDQPQHKRELKVNVQNLKTENQASSTRTPTSTSTVPTDKANNGGLDKITSNKVTTPNNKLQSIHQPLRISSLLNPIYIPKSSSATNSSLVDKDNNENKKTDIKPTEFAKLSSITEPSTSTNPVFIKPIHKAEPSPEKKVMKKTLPQTQPSTSTEKNITSILPVSSQVNDSKKTSDQNIVDKIDKHSRRRQLIIQLEQSIAKGDEQAAAEAAAKLAQLRLSCSVLSFSSQIVNEASPSSSNPDNNKKVTSTKTSPTKEISIPSTSKLNTTLGVLQKNEEKKTVNDKNSSINESKCNQSKPSTSKSDSAKDIVNNVGCTEKTSVPSQTREENNIITVEVTVEDKEAARGPVRLRIPRRALLSDLRREAEASLGLAVRLQRWIIGRTLCAEDNIPVMTLAGADFSAPFYLCLVESDVTAEVTHPKGKQTPIEADKTKLIQGEVGNVYTELVQLELRALVPNTEPFECEVCMENCAAGDGAVLRECVHSFCRGCLTDVIRHSEEPVISCPATGCPGNLQEREIRALVTEEEYERWLARGLATAESGTRNSFHCRTPNCTGWALCEPGVLRFPCPVCKRINCVPCQAIHEGETCEQYRAKLQKATAAAGKDQTDKGTRALLDALIAKGEALECPECSAIITKKWGCDWIKCSACKTEICWVTRGRRWGPGGRGDTSGGCRCGVDGKRCHPSCGYCH